MVLSKMVEFNEEMKHTHAELKRLGAGTVLSKPAASPFVTHENLAFDRMIEVYEGSSNHTWEDDSNKDHNGH